MSTATIGLFFRTGRLYAVPSFVEGLGRVLDIGSTLNEYNEDNTPNEADYLSILGDWYAVGDVIRSAVNDYETEESKKNK